MKKITIIIILIASIVAIACALSGKVKGNKASTEMVHWSTRYPQLNTLPPNIGNSPFSTNTSSESYTSLEDKITNKYGIRDDILEYILKTIPNNESALFAAIRVAQYSSLVRGSYTRESALYYQKKDGVAINCLSNAIGIQQTENYILKLDKLFTNTPLGEAQEERARKLLAWQFIGPDLTFEQMDQLCKSYDY